MISPGETEAGTAGMQPLPRDNLAGLIETMTGARRRGASALSKTPIGSVDPYALKIPARRAESLFTTPRHTVSTHRHRAFAMWLRLARQNGSLPRRP